MTVIVPVFNEQHLVSRSVERLKILGTSPYLSRVEVIVVDDCSRDDTPQILNRFRAEQEREATPNFDWMFIRHERNCGKGGAVLTALERASCDISVIHDADLEYHP